MRDTLTIARRSGYTQQMWEALALKLEQEAIEAAEDLLLESDCRKLAPVIAIRYRGAYRTNDEITVRDILKYRT